ncbi:hypothetical protein [Thioclava sp. GXIMD4216]|uniref:hypothetical protein n=1 Tax=Thioclava sp. GXIMD4216 TaxID=3131929 RepID=UPI0030CD346F
MYNFNSLWRIKKSQWTITNGSNSTLHHVTRLLSEGRLASAVLTYRESGVLGLRLNPTDLVQALEQSNVRDLTLREAQLALGVNEASIRKLRYTGCLPSYSLAVDSVVPRRILIPWDAMKVFQAKYMSVKVAARQTGLTGTEIRYLARSRGLGFAPELGDLPFYPTHALLQINAEARNEMAAASD